jgi:hypothetical protein
MRRKVVEQLFLALRGRRSGLQYLSELIEPIFGWRQFRLLCAHRDLLQDNYSALDMAILRGHTEAERLLKAAGAKRRKYQDGTLCAGCIM